MSFSKLPYLLDALWPIIATPDHFPVFKNEKDSEAGIVPFVVMLYAYSLQSMAHVFYVSVVFALF